MIGYLLASAESAEVLSCLRYGGAEETHQDSARWCSSNFHVKEYFVGDLIKM